MCCKLAVLIASLMSNSSLLCLMHSELNSTNRIIGLDKQKIWAENCEYFLSIRFNICFGCSKDTHWDSSFEYLQHMFSLRNKKNNFQSNTLD